ncbi:MAG TPA: Trk system potassium transporter TrkA [Longimicrobiales bacterium]|nr:Trk system potassium transporter TrkA [Longimicrobiales bacterium]
MRVVIVGAGSVGSHLAERLSEEGQDVVVIESDARRAAGIGDRFDVMTIVGNGASLPNLEKAGTDKADLFLAVSGEDEVNLVACLAASRMGARFKVARISNPEYYNRGNVLSREHLGVDLMINPERECAWETFQLLNSEAATDLVRFADGRVQLVGLRVKEGAAVAGKRLVDIGRELAGRHYITVAIVRSGVTEIPTGNSRIEAGDQIYVLAPSNELDRLAPMAGYPATKLRRVMIAGGPEETVYLGQYLEEHKVECTVLDIDRARCAELAELLPAALILHADATNLELLEMEGIEGADGFVAYTGHDDTNMLSSLLAKSSGARRVISMIQRFDYMPLVSRVGIDAAVSPKMSTVNAILRYVRRGNVLSVATLKGIDAEALELDVKPGAKIAGRTLREVDFPDDAVLGIILRGDEVILPRGNDVVLAQDKVIVFALPTATHELEALFA